MCLFVLLAAWPGGLGALSLLWGRWSPGRGSFLVWELGWRFMRPQLPEMELRGLTGLAEPRV